MLNQVHHGDTPAYRRQGGHRGRFSMIQSGDGDWIITFLPSGHYGENFNKMLGKEAA